MHRKDYSLIANHELRNILRNVCNDPRDLPGKKELRAQLVEALPDAEADVIDALMTKATEFARGSRRSRRPLGPPGKRRRARASRGQAYAAADLLVPAEEDEDTEPVDVADVLDSIELSERGSFHMEQKARAAEQAAFRRNAGLK